MEKIGRREGSLSPSCRKPLVSKAVWSSRRTREVMAVAEGVELGSNILHAAIVARPLRCTPTKFSLICSERLSGPRYRPRAHWAPKCSSAPRAPQVAPGGPRSAEVSTAHLEPLGARLEAPSTRNGGWAGSDPLHAMVAGRLVLSRVTGLRQLCPCEPLQPWCLQLRL